LFSDGSGLYQDTSVRNGFPQNFYSEEFDMYRENNNLGKYLETADKIIKFLS
jgi:hypothetical protein